MFTLPFLAEKVGKKANLLFTLFAGINIGSCSHVAALLDFKSQKPLQLFEVPNNCL